MYCLVIEWADGTVDVNGPYPDAPTAEKAASLLAEKIRVDEEEADGYAGLKVFGSGEFFRIGDAEVESINDIDDGIDVYVRGMGEPLKTD